MTVAKACPLGPNEVLIVCEAVSGAEQDQLASWAAAAYRDGHLFENPADPGAWCSAFESIRGGLTPLAAGSGQAVIWRPSGRDAHRLPEAFWSIRRRIADLLHLENRAEDPYKGSFLSHIAPGTGVHTHVDARLEIESEAHLLLRCNVLLRRPTAGGLPVIESRPIEVPDRGLWAFFPSELAHGATAVEGTGFRTLLSYGFVVAPDEVWARVYRLTRAFATEYNLDGSATASGRLLQALAASPEASALERSRHDVFGLALSRPTLSVAQAAFDTGHPAAELWPIFRDLQRAAIIEPVELNDIGRGTKLLI